MSERRKPGRQEESAPTTHVLDEIAASIALGISAKTLSRLRESGEIGHVRIGRRVVYRPSHIDAFLSKNEKPAQAS